jgi:hypothetical protein
LVAKERHADDNLLFDVALELAGGKEVRAHPDPAAAAGVHRITACDVLDDHQSDGVHVSAVGGSHLAQEVPRGDGRLLQDARGGGGADFGVEIAASHRLGCVILDDEGDFAGRRGGRRQKGRENEQPSRSHGERHYLWHVLLRSYERAVLNMQVISFCLVI